MAGRMALSRMTSVVGRAVQMLVRVSMSQGDGFEDGMYLRVFKGRVIGRLCASVRSFRMVSESGLLLEVQSTFGAKTGRVIFSFLGRQLRIRLQTASVEAESRVSSHMQT